MTKLGWGITETVISCNYKCRFSMDVLLHAYRMPTKHSILVCRMLPTEEALDPIHRFAWEQTVWLIKS